MFSKIIGLEWKSFLRSSSFKKGIAMKIFLVFFTLYLIVCFSFLGAGSYFIAAKSAPAVDPLLTVCRYIVLWFVFDLLLRFFMQKLPVFSIKAFVILPIKKKAIVNYLLLKSAFSVFNLLPLFFLLPFAVVLLVKGYAVLNVLSWLLCLVLLVLVNNYINFIVNKSNAYFYAVLSALLIGAAVHYFGFFDIVSPIGAFYFGMYKQPLFIVIPLGLLFLFYGINYRHFLVRFYLDDSLFDKKEKLVSSSEFSWLNRFGDVAPFLINDIKLIWRNKRPRSLFFMSSFILLYGLMIFTNPVYGEGFATMHVFVSLFISGIFLVNFGQLIPSWDSAYFNLLMAQNISMYQYLNAKRILLLFSIVMLTLLSLPYFYFGWKVGLLLILGGVYNAGFNLPIVLLLCAFNQKAIDLSKGAMMNYEGMGAVQWLMIVPLFLVTIGLFSLVNYLCSFYMAVAVLFSFGFIGIVMQKHIMRQLVKLYQKRKYKMIIGFQQK